MPNRKKWSLTGFLWDLWCVVSIVGIWPRFIEPATICTTRLSLKIPKLKKRLKVVQFSDLHLNAACKGRFLKKLKRKIEALQPDILVFTGDFLCYGKLEEEERLTSFLNSLPAAPCGNFAILGNHDYAQFVSVDQKGDYAVSKKTGGSVLAAAFSLLFKKRRLTKQITPEAKAVPPHPQLLQLLAKTPFKLLHNAHVITDGVNICGLGEYMLGKLEPEKAFSGYDPKLPGIILVHNPDGIPYLKEYPGDLYLTGHTHAGQVNVLGMWRRFTLLENMQFRKGYHRLNGRHLYVNRGIGGVMPFRWRASPELTLYTLEPA